ncbi:alpha/beta hydrolase-fold protein [Arthrobacter sp. APC 3897]|uniref:alpha/beta hydrolase n=1 Tax=Arthrobacter sp. APC 3897 TaxID=3035204 RepID=UPI0025B60855|nr:alpha/beta hydrolase-fold protein [Arthrobacter sp. APC 3897]MDN3482529.1 alpha/beta hydrolase-fold protein [Arthrobacter sp. APC 3897]
MNSVSLLTGVVPVVLLALGGMSLIWLASGGARHLLVVVPAAALASAALTFSLFLLAEGVFHWWDASFPRILYVYAGLGILAVILAGVRLRTGRSAPPKILALTAASLALLAVAVTVNAAYAQYPTLESLVSPPRPVDEALPERDPATAAGLPATTEANWTAPPDMPSEGRIYSAEIPGSTSGYASNSALVYLPPAYLASPAAVNLPVLVLIHGQPGNPSDWLVGGQLLTMVDTFAAKHHGLAPVVVMPDASNADNANWPLCLDSDISSSATYLAVDLPAWVRQHLAAGLSGGSQWAVAGYSYGGTCALQLATNFPDTYPTFIDIAGESAPTVTQGQDFLINTYFGGNKSRFTSQNALDLLAAKSFPDSAGIFAVGADDSVYTPEGRRVYAAAKAAGMDVSLQVLPGGHSWQVWKAGLANNLDWLCRRLGILGS